MQNKIFITKAQANRLCENYGMNEDFLIRTNLIVQLTKKGMQSYLKLYYPECEYQDDMEKHISIELFIDKNNVLKHCFAYLENDEDKFLVLKADGVNEVKWTEETLRLEADFFNGMREYFSCIKPSKIQMPVIFAIQYQIEHLDEHIKWLKEEKEREAIMAQCNLTNYISYPVLIIVLIGAGCIGFGFLHLNFELVEFGGRILILLLIFSPVILIVMFIVAYCDMENRHSHGIYDKKKDAIDMGAMGASIGAGCGLGKSVKKILK